MNEWKRASARKCKCKPVQKDEADGKTISLIREVTAIVRFPERGRVARFLSGRIRACSEEMVGGNSWNNKRNEYETLRKGSEEGWCHQCQILARWMGKACKGSFLSTPMQNNPEQDRRIKDLRSPKENDKFTEEPGEGCLTRIVLGRM